MSAPSRRGGRAGAGKVLAPPVEREVDGLRVRLTRKNVKNLSVRIARDGGGVEVSLPAGMSERRALEYVRERRAWIDEHLAHAAQTPAARAEHATPEELARWCADVEARVSALVAAWEPVMGVKAGAIVYRNMKSRWGSCRPDTGRICINIRLALYPAECLEYVVVHELCHLLERGHGPRFQALMDGFLPDWRDRRAKLR